jgi:hypothetical protein
MLIYVTLWFKKKHRPCQIGVGRLVPLKLGYFQGQQVNLPEGNMKNRLKICGSPRSSLAQPLAS